MIIQSTTHLANYAENAPGLNWSVSHIPYPADGRKTTMSTGSAVVVPRGTQKTEAVAEFLRFLAKKETQMDWYRLTDQPPARLDAVLDLIQLGEVASAEALTLWELMPLAEGYPPLFASHVILPLREQLNQMRARVITPDQALENLQRNVEPEFSALTP